MLRLEHQNLVHRKNKRTETKVMSEEESKTDCGGKLKRAR